MDHDDNQTQQALAMLADALQTSIQANRALLAMLTHGDWPTGFDATAMRARLESADYACRILGSPSEAASEPQEPVRPESAGTTESPSPDVPDLSETAADEAEGVTLGDIEDLDAEIDSLDEDEPEEA
jgi:hypothetical protein